MQSLAEQIATKANDVVTLDSLPTTLLNALLFEARNELESATDLYKTIMSASTTSTSTKSVEKAVMVVRAASQSAWCSFANDRLQTCLLRLGDWSALEQWQQTLRDARKASSNVDVNAAADNDNNNNNNVTSAAQQTQLAKLDSLIDENFVQALAAYSQNDVARAAKALAVTPISVLSGIAVSQQPTLARCDEARRRMSAERIMLESLVHMSLRQQIEDAHEAAVEAVKADIDALWSRPAPRLRAAAAPLPAEALSFANAALQPPLRMLGANDRLGTTLYALATHRTQLDIDETDTLHIDSVARNIIEKLPHRSAVKLVGSVAWHDLSLRNRKIPLHVAVSAIQQRNFQLASRLLDKR